MKILCMQGCLVHMSLIIHEVVTRGLGCAFFFPCRILYKLWSGRYKPLLAEHFQELDQFHPFERDNVIGIIEVLIGGGGLFLC